MQQRNAHNLEQGVQFRSRDSFNVKPNHSPNTLFQQFPESPSERKKQIEYASVSKAVVFSMFTLVVVVGVISQGQSLASSTVRFFSGAGQHEGTVANPIRVNKRTINFLIVGDWGIGEDDPMRVNDIPHQKLVAGHLLSWANRVDAKFVISTGDQVYPHGVTGIQDRRYLELFSKFAKAKLGTLDWYATLGNHDCEGDVGAILQLGNTINDYILQNRVNLNMRSTSERPYMLSERKGYYTVDRTFDGLEYPKDTLRIVVLNSCTLACSAPIRNFRCDPSKNDYGFLVGGLKHFDTAEMKEERRNQIIWLTNVLSQPNPNPEGKLWKIVVSHWPVFSFKGNGPSGALHADILPLLKHHRVHAFFNGHDHSLQHIRTVRKDSIGYKYTTAETQFFVSGAGGFRIHPTLKHDAESELNEGAKLVASRDNHGFMVATLTDGGNQLGISFINGDTGGVQYQTQVDWF